MVDMPEYIKKAVDVSAKHYAIAIKNNNIVRQWLYKNNLLNDGNIDQLIDATEMSNNPDGFIHFMKTEAFEGNEDAYKGDYD